MTDTPSGDEAEFDSEAWEHARNIVVSSEQERRAEEGLPFARDANLGIEWSSGAPEPTVFWSIDGVVVWFYESDADDSVGMLVFSGARLLRSGPGWDARAYANHPLYWCGLDGAAHIIENSSETAEGQTHFFLTFHDESIEVIGRNVEVRRHPGPIRAAVAALFTGAAASQGFDETPR